MIPSTQTKGYDYAPRLIFMTYIFKDFLMMKQNILMFENTFFPVASVAAYLLKIDKQLQIYTLDLFTGL